MGQFYWISSYPKSGNTWMRALIRNYQSDGASPISINNLHTGFSSIDRNWIDDISGLNSMDFTDDELDFLRPAIYSYFAKCSRNTTFHKTHESLGQLRSQNKRVLDFDGVSGSIYIVRHPFAVAASLSDFLGITHEKAVDIMLDQNFCIEPVDAYTGQVRQAIGSWAEHVNGWYQSSSINTLVIRYEDLYSSPLRAFSEVVRFSGLKYNRARLEMAIKNSCFSVLQTQERSGGFRETRDNKPFFRYGMGRSRATPLSPRLKDTLTRHCSRIMRRFGYA